ncbi:hypothetical protein ACETRX_22680 [Labrys portucalensis]|uniref:Uncharacterized protein n=1 Tax=Labrys neptuniae TaxID=376174 RepID=A0ABV6ZJV0_9HYPH
MESVRSHWRIWGRRVTAAGACIVLALIAVLLIWWAASGDACELATHLNDGKGACFEFWLNRYQTLITGILAVVAASVGAVIAWRAAILEIEHAKKSDSRVNSENWELFKKTALSVLASVIKVLEEINIESTAHNVYLKVDASLMHLDVFRQSMSGLKEQCTGKTRGGMNAYELLIGNIATALQKLLDTKDTFPIELFKSEINEFRISARRIKDTLSNQQYD